ncbi:MAG: hypothetical protein JXQ65_14745 [Candidatus Marinimicrobia bacterium]|nr:hypothetical protein [Candidatus Neomarinimicrobiota bacterium]
MKKLFILSLIILQSLTIKGETNLTGPGSYKILSENKQPIKIPFKMADGKPALDCIINGKPAKLMIDNGILWDEVWLFGSPLVDELNLKPEVTGQIGGAGEGDPTEAYISEPISLKFDDIIFYEQPVIISPSAVGFTDMFPKVDGQLCNTFFKHFLVEFDFIDNYVILHKPEDFKFDKNGCVLEMNETPSETHSVPFSFTMLDGKKYDGQVDIDFGGIYPFKIALNNELNIQLPDDVEPINNVFGAQGKISQWKGQIKSMTFGKYLYKNPTVMYGNRESSRIHPENLGVLGLPLFMDFDITFDYINGKLYLLPNKNYTER